MGLRNAFEEIATEGTLRRLLDQLRFSKDAQDRMRVTVDNQPNVGINMGNTTTSMVNAGTQPSYFGTGSWNIMDSRETMRESTAQTFQITRNRWTIT